MQIGQKIRKLRELKNFTQEYMAEQLEMTQPSYSKIENGETDVSYSKLEKIAKSLNIKPEDILAFDEHMIFNIMHNKDVQNGFIINQMSDDVRKLYDAQISSLKSENEHLKSLIENLLKR